MVELSGYIQGVERKCNTNVGKILNMQSAWTFVSCLKVEDSNTLLTIT